MAVEGERAVRATTHHRELSPDGLLVTRVHGEVHLEDCMRALDATLGFVRDRRFYELVLHGPEVAMRGDFHDIQRFVAHAREVLARLEAGAIAFVAANKVVYGSCRQMRALMSSEQVPIEVFVDEEPARAWLRERMADTPFRLD